jgi:hypothetical protein
MRSPILTGALFLSLTLPAMAQVATPRPSQHASVSQTIGTTEITVDYHRPGVKGRSIWGGLVPFDQPWRMGANEATTITFSKAVKVEGQDVPAGTYSFFAIPSRDKWTLILNKDPKQWGAYGYDQSKDQIRATVTPAKGPQTEWMRFTIDPVTPTSALVTLNWETLSVPMKVDVDVTTGVWTEVDAALKKLRTDEAQTLASAANWALDSGQRLEEGLGWVDRSIAVNENVFNLWTKARLLQKLGRAREAVPVMEKALSMAKAANMPADFMGILEGTMKSIRADVK